MSNTDAVPEEVIDRVTRVFTTTTDPQPVLTPSAMAQALKTLGWSVGDAAVLAIYEEARRRLAAIEQDPAALESRDFLADHAMYELWKVDVAANRTLAGFLEWREGRS